MLENFLAMGLLNALVLLILSYMIWQNDGIEHAKKFNYLWAILATAAVVLAEVGTVLYEGGALASRPLYIACNVAGFSMTPLISVLLATVFGNAKVRELGLVLLPCYANALLALLSPVYGFIFTVSQEGAYQRGSLFAVFIAAYIWGVMVLLGAIVNAGKRYRYRLRGKLLAMFAFLILGTTTQIVFPAVHTSWTSVTLVLALHYGFVCEFNGSLDALTKLYNRKSYASEIERLKKKTHFAVILMDVDDFKRVNDLYGHPYGDQCLAKLAALMHETFYKIGTCYRIGGDEFCVLCSTVDEEKLTSEMQFLTAKIEVCRVQDPLLPWISYGCHICVGAQGENIIQTIQAADRQMYASKARHKAESAGQVFEEVE